MPFSTTIGLHFQMKVLFLATLTIGMQSPRALKGVRDRDIADVIELASKNLPFDHPLLFQVEYNSRLNPKFTIRPLLFNKDRKGPSPARDWIATVTFTDGSHGRVGHISVMPNAATPKVPRGDQRGEAAKGAVALLNGSDLKRIPFIISVSKYGNEWKIGLDPDLRLGGYKEYILSPDFHGIRPFR